MSSIRDNLTKIHLRINAALQGCGRPESKVTLLCVSKTKPIEQILEAYAAGEREFGESYATEAAAKIEKLRELGYTDLRWHFIGPLQKNKTRLIAGHFDVVQSVDRPEVAQRLNDQRPDALPPLEVMVQVNISAESQKSGCTPEQLPGLLDLVCSLPRLRLTGLMGIAREGAEEAELKKSFDTLRELSLQYREKFAAAPLLSMGMTSDLESAIACGSDMVRIGTAIFGAREYPHRQAQDELRGRVAFIGGGNMSSCIYESVLKQLKPEQITISGPHPEKLLHFQSRGSRITQSNTAALEDAEVVFLGVKPQVLPEVLQELAAGGRDLSSILFISMAAGFRLRRISAALGTRRVVRIMPNTPAKIGQGVTALCYDEGVSATDRSLCEKLLAGMGLSVPGSEEQLNVIGAICGCGPAFVFRFMEALSAQAQRHGLNPELARSAVEQTLLGAALLSSQSHAQSLAALREAVTSKGGTTFAGLQAMSAHGFEDLIQDTVQASLDRTAELEGLL